MVHNFKGKLLLSEESLVEQRPNIAMLNIGQGESPLEKYITSQVGTAQQSTLLKFFITISHYLFKKGNKFINQWTGINVGVLVKDLCDQEILPPKSNISLKWGKEKFNMLR